MIAPWSLMNRAPVRADLRAHLAEIRAKAERRVADERAAELERVSRALVQNRARARDRRALDPALFADGGPIRLRRQRQAPSAIRPAVKKRRWV
jgi:hypothetical protein